MYQTRVVSRLNKRNTVITKEKSVFRRCPLIPLPSCYLPQLTPLTSRLSSLFNSHTLSALCHPLSVFFSSPPPRLVLPALSLSHKSVNLFCFLKFLLYLTTLLLLLLLLLLLFLSLFLSVCFDSVFLSLRG